MGLVQHVLGRITNELAKKVASHSIPAVLNAQPIKPLPNERPKKEKGFSPHIYYSPEHKSLNLMSSPESALELESIPIPELESISQLRIIPKTSRNFESKIEEDEDEW